METAGRSCSREGVLTHGEEFGERGTQVPRWWESEEVTEGSEKRGQSAAKGLEWEAGTR